MKKWIIRIVVLLIVLLIAVSLYIEINKEALVQAGIDDYNQSIDGQITYEDVEVSLFRSLPDLKITLKGMVLSSDLDSQGIDLFKSDEVSTDVSLQSIFQSSSPIKIRSLHFHDANLHIVKSKEGVSNYDIFPEGTSSSQDQNIDLDIQDFIITTGTISYFDQISNFESRIENLYVKGDVSLINDRIKISSQIASRIGIKPSKISPNYWVDVQAQTIFEMNSKADNIQLKSCTASLNDLPIEVSGNLDVSGPNAKYSFDISSPSTEVKRLISLVPAYFNNDYDKIVSQGTYSLKATLESPGTGIYPLYNIHVIAKDGRISYPGLPNSLDHVSFSLLAENKNTWKGYTKVLLDDILIKSGESILEGTFSSIEQSESHKTEFDFQVDASLEDLKEGVMTSDTLILEGLIKGHLKGGAQFNSKMSDLVVSQELFDSHINVSDLKYKSKSSQLSIDKMVIDGDKEELQYSMENMSFKEAAELTLKGNILRPLSSLLDTNIVITGQTSITSGTIDLNALASDKSGSLAKYDIPQTNMEVSFEGQKLIQSSYLFEGLKYDGRIKNTGSTGTFSIESFEGSSISGNMTLDNVLEYSLNNDTLRGNLVVRANTLMLDTFLSGDSEERNTKNEQELIPSNVDLDIDFSSDEVKFKNIEILKALGQVKLSDQKLIFKNEGEICGGRVIFSGTFDSKRDEGYHIGLNLDLKNLQFAETASRIKLFSQLIPIAKLLEGAYTSTLSWDSDLSKMYIPDLNSLSAYGEIETQDGSINGFLPIDTFIRKIVQLKEDRAIKISDTKRYFLVEDGKVIVKEIGLERDDIYISLTGSHSFSQDLNYVIKVDVPKSKLKSDDLLRLVQNRIGFSDIIKSATDDIIVQVVIKMEGKVLDPTFSVQQINLKKGNIVESIGEQAISTLESARDSISRTVRDTIQATRDNIKEKLDSTKESILNTIDSTASELKEQLDTTIASLEDVIRSEEEDIKSRGDILLDSLKAGNTDSLFKNIEDLFGDKKDLLDSLKNTIPIDIFKKKNKSGNQN